MSIYALLNRFLNTMVKVSEDSKIIAKKIAQVFGGKFNLDRFWDENNSHHVDILCSPEELSSNRNFFATVSLSDHPLIRYGEEFHIRLEILGSCMDSYEFFPNILSTAAFCIINSKWFCAPGLIFPDIVSMYYPDLEMKHLLFAPPFVWDDLGIIELGDKKVAFLLAVPISEMERRYSIENQNGELEKLLEENRVEISNLGRSSVL
jgi:antitoxin YqcF